MKKYLYLLLFFCTSALVMSSCSNEEIEPKQGKLVGTWVYENSGTEYNHGDVHTWKNYTTYTFEKDGTWTCVDVEYDSYYMDKAERTESNGGYKTVPSEHKILMWKTDEHDNQSRVSEFDIFFVDDDVVVIDNTRYEKQKK